MFNNSYYKWKIDYLENSLEIERKISKETRDREFKLASECDEQEKTIERLEHELKKYKPRIEYLKKMNLLELLKIAQKGLGLGKFYTIDECDRINIINPISKSKLIELIFIEEEKIEKYM